MNELDLKFICDPKNSNRGNSVWLYWSSELYGFGKQIRKYGHYPSFLPLAIYSDHSGPSFSDVPYIHEEKNRAPIFFAHRPIKVENYIKITGKKAHTLFSPTVFYRRSNEIKISDTAEGTVCFPVHSLPNSGFNFDIDKYCNELKKLPKIYHPIKVCLHMHDINNDTFKEYEKNGIEVLSAGNTSDQRFVERLYEIIKQSKFITSNDVGTITFLAVEMRIPFFIYGDKEETINLSDPNFNKGVIKAPTHKQYVGLRKKLVINTDFSLNEYDDQLIYDVEDALGIYKGVSRKKMCLILYYALFLWIVKFEWYFWLKGKMNK